MTVINTGLTAAGLKAEFQQRFGEIHPKTFWGDLATTIKSNKAKETYAWMGTTPPMREWGTGRLARGMHSESYDVENQKYEATIEVDRDEISDDQTGAIRMRVGELALRAATHKDKLVGDLLKNGTTSGFNSYDGVTFFNATHESGDSGSQSNLLAPAIVDKDAPTTAEWRSSLAAGIAKLLSYKDDQGEPMSQAGDGLIAIVPGSIFVTALEAVSATIVQSTTNVMAGACRVIAFPQLSATDVWYLLKTNVAVRPFVFQDREPLEFAAIDRPDDEEVFMREKYLYGVRARYRMAYGYWQYALRVGFTTA